MKADVTLRLVKKRQAINQLYGGGNPGHVEAVRTWTVKQKNWEVEMQTAFPAGKPV